MQPWIALARGSASRFRVPAGQGAGPGEGSARAARVVLLALAAAVSLPASAEARGGRGGHLIHRIFPGTFAAGEGKQARTEKDKACRMAWQASLTPERPSYTPYPAFRKAHCAHSTQKPRTA
jgi:hypothetical protein